ncbi:MAG: lipoyl domain-containing protein, partial [Planctomycetota bacterium]|nr:lipoyl domain-containing protein [Planctomycetota bacterium]
MRHRRPALATNVIVPDVGMAVETCRLLRWLKAEGAPVVQGEPLVEVETGKVTVEIEAPASGTLAAVSASEGDDVPLGQTIAVILAEGEAPPPRGRGTPKAPPAVGAVASGAPA